MALDLRRAIFHEYRDSFFISIAFATSAFAWRPESSLLPAILNLSILLTYTPFLFRKDDPYRLIKVSSTGLAISVGEAMFNLHASARALSSKSQSIIMLFILSSILSAFSLITLWAGTKFSTRFSSPWAQVTLFPSMWATLWYTTAYFSPFGYLSTWKIADNADAYNWIVPYVGPTSKDWIVGAWAVILSQTVTSWFMGHQDEAEGVSYNNTSNTRKLLAVFLILLTLPSFIIDHLPLPIFEIEKATPLTVGCVIPPYQRYKHHVPSLDDYIAESAKLRGGGARVILWPEGAVVFKSTEEKNEAFKKIRINVPGPYVGVAFEETVSDSSDPIGKASLSRTGLAVISQYSEEPHLVYYKRNLVPVAESYHLQHSVTPPSIFIAQIPNPGHGITKPEWSPDGNHTRPIPITASICLDFAIPSPFANLDSRPGLILAPARTWDRTVGHAMWLQAKQRAEELNSMVLWCDGGHGGVSGVAGGGFNDVSQVGSGSFVQTIGVQYPFDSRRSPYGRFGDSALILLWLSILAPISSAFQSNLKGGIQRVLSGSFMHGRPPVPNTVPNTGPPNLVDV